MVMLVQVRFLTAQTKNGVPGGGAVGQRQYLRLAIRTAFPQVTGLFLLQEMRYRVAMGGGGVIVHQMQ